MNKTISFGKRFLGSLLDWLLNGLGTLIIVGPIIHLVIVIVTKKTVGAHAVGYKYMDRKTNKDADLLRMFIYFLFRLPAFLAHVLSFSVTFWIALSQQEKNQGTWAEKWAGIVKLNKTDAYVSSEESTALKLEEAKRQEAMASEFKDTRTGEPALEVKNFTKHYRGRPKPAVSNVSFRVYPGEFHGFIGANGAGKTTSIKSIIGAYAKYEGEVEIFGKSNKTVEAKKELGYIPEAANFPKKFTTLEYITHMSKLSGLSKKEAKERAIKSLEEANLMSIAKVSPNTLSSGQKKKVLLAQALVHNPSIVVMDEPAANLDPKARIEFFDTLRHLQKDKKSILISSHILAELDKYIDSVTILDGGKVVYSGLVKELTRNPELTFRLNTSDNKAIKDYLDKKGLKYKMSRDKVQVILADMLNSKNILELQKFIISKGLLIEEFKNNVITVEQVYENFVKYGSVDTGAGKKITEPIAKKSNDKKVVKERNISEKASTKKGGK